MNLSRILRHNLLGQQTCWVGYVSSVGPAHQRDRDLRGCGGGGHGTPSAFDRCEIGWNNLLQKNLRGARISRGLSRTREYYADRHSATLVDDGAQKLSSGLARIVHSTQRTSRSKQDAKNQNAFKALFIADPDRANVDSQTLATMEASGQALVQEILAKKPTFADKLIEALSTHPNIVKRLQALQELS